MSWQQSCGDTCPIWTWFNRSNSYFCGKRNAPYGYFNGGVLQIQWPPPSGKWVMYIRSPKWLGRFGPGSAPCEQNIKENAIRCNDRDGAKPSLQKIWGTLPRDWYFDACWNCKSFMDKKYGMSLDSHWWRYRIILVPCLISAKSMHLIWRSGARSSNQLV